MDIVPMNKEQADEYVHWRYQEPYTFYNIPEAGIDETYDEIFTDPDIFYFSVLRSGDLFGIFEYTLSKNCFETGLGITPNETGKGYGRQFVTNCMAFGRKQFDHHGPISLEVADFNHRAIHLYKQLGFVEKEKMNRLSFGKPVTFIRMETYRMDFSLTYTVQSI